MGRISLCRARTFRTGGYTGHGEPLAGQSNAQVFCNGRIILDDKKIRLWHS